MKTNLIGFLIGETYKSRCVSDVKHQVISVRDYTKRFPKAELEQAARYTDHSLANAQKKADVIKNLGVKYWLDTNTFSSNNVDLSFEFQGQISGDGHFYSCDVKGHPSKAHAKILSKITSSIDYGAIQSPEALVKILVGMNLMPVEYEKETHIFYPLNSFQLIQRSMEATSQQLAS